MLDDYEICQFLVNYEIVVFYSQGPRTTSAKNFLTITSNQ